MMRMTFYALLLIALCVVQNSWADESSSTHMPDTVDPTIPPDVEASLESAVPDCDCETILRKNATAVIHTLLARIGNKSEPVEPCESVFQSGTESWEIIPGEVKVAKHGEEGLVIQATGRFKQVNFSCSSCTFLDDSGTNQTGNMTLVWTNGTLTYTIVRNSETNSSTVQFLLPLAGNANNETVQAICEGSPEFVAVCHESKNSGELDHNFKNKAEELVAEEEDNPNATAVITELYEPYFRCKRPA